MALDAETRNWLLDSLLLVNVRLTGFVTTGSTINTPCLVSPFALLKLATGRRKPPQSDREASYYNDRWIKVKTMGDRTSDVAKYYLKLGTYGQ